MAIVLPILSEFKDKGIKDANKAFKDLEGFGAKAGFALKKAFVPATAALAGLAAVGFDAVKAALDDAAAQEKLENQLKRVTKATKEQIAESEKFISKLMFASNVADDELRPALAQLATATGDLEGAQKTLTLAVDIAAQTGKPLESVASALGRAYNGQYTSLLKLDPSLRDVVKSGESADEVFGRLNDKFGGAAQQQTETTAGKFENLKLRVDEFKESVGQSLIPLGEGLLPYLESFATWAEENPQVFKTVAAAIAGVAGSIVLINLALATNPIVLIAAAIAGLAIVIAMNWPAIKGFFQDMGREIDNLLGPLDELFGFFGSQAGQAFSELNNIFGGGKADPRFGEDLKRRKIPKMAKGGIVTGPTLALIGEAGPEAVVPLSGRSGLSTGGVTVNVSGALDPVAVGNQIRDILRNQDARFGY